MALLEKLQGRALLPCLQQLTWVWPIDQSSLLAVFLSPSLRTIRLHLVGCNVLELRYRDSLENPQAGEYATGTALQILHARSPNVDCLTLHTKGFPCSINPLRLFSNLRSLALKELLNLNLAFILDACSSLPLLQKLELHSAQYVGQPRPVLPATSLPQLGQLHLCGCPYASSALSWALHAPVLKSIGLEYRWRDHVAWTRCVDAVASRLGTFLTSLQVEVYDNTDSERCFKFHDWFSALYAITDLRDVSVHKALYSHTLFTIFANDMENVASKWPNLRVLELQGTFHQLSPEFPITALATLTQNCP
ncbi:uncharacterized protein TRAVEDRAFT_52588 [Trametes versicolor FP-101664 SS1]|uniref:uncharacterized protein n=1 Tax=Trametes versicolor (strain FP-101664) TaxID=717944 RepID=UPI000462284A|nr:uncharacterized protein TRAVEDRAFT_52588 [Trametes versicolor FP-101664 SS1]EIW53459.1 hypothetical protein TRAVEDRAFT_52588 [Trametes versicolor FP-101664 SS1]